jgi:hypothetical protein
VPPVRPTNGQLDAFARHLASAHSWYKHLPLIRGGEFVVFLADDAGAGYSEDRPRLHHGWKTTTEHRERFGYLDYVWRTDPAHAFRRDAGAAPITLPPAVLERCRLTLYPYASWDAEVDSFCVAQREDFEALEKGAAHPERERLLALFHVNGQKNSLYERFSKEQAEASCVEQPCDSEVSAYLELERQELQLHAELNDIELARITNSLAILVELTTT